MVASLSRPIRVIAATPQPLFGDALGRAIRADERLDLVGTPSDSRAVADALARLRPDVAVVDIGLLRPGWRPGATRVLLLAGEVAAVDAFAAIERGAAGYLSKDADGAWIRRAIVAAARGDTVLDAAARTGVAGEIRLRTRDDRPALSPRERQILVLVAEGRTAPEIARRLHLGVATVKTHLLHLYDKLGVAERAAAVAEAMRRGLLE